jgi:hypothetical protein
MTNAVNMSSWIDYFKHFTERNMYRPVRLELFGNSGGEQVDCLPLTGVSVELEGEEAPRVAIMFGGKSAAGSEHLTHTIKSVKQIMRQTSKDNRDSAVEFQSKGEKIALLCFESKSGVPLEQIC